MDNLTPRQSRRTRWLDAAGNDIVSYVYKPFGEIQSQTGSNPNPFRFEGEQHDAESGYTYLRARYYDPAIGRLISRDAASRRLSPGSWNRWDAPGRISSAPGKLYEAVRRRGVAP